MMKRSQRSSPIETKLDRFEWRSQVAAILLLLVAGLIQVANCEPSQRSSAGSNELSQDSFGASLSDVPSSEALLSGLGNFGRGAYMNSKRARKMSAFMPMRGRKDGRDGGQHQSRQLELLEAAAADAMAATRNRDTQAREPLLHRMGLFGQLAGLVGGQQDSALVKAKFRRAFHPMRGKRSDLDQIEDRDNQLDGERDIEASSGRLFAPLSALELVGQDQNDAMDLFSDAS